MFTIPCVIFAGGKSSRMGEDKALLPFAGFSTLAEYQHSKLSKLFKNVYISCKDKNKFDFEADFIEDAKGSDIFAPTAGFIASFKKLQRDSFFAISVDTPFVSKNEILQIIHADQESSDITIAKTDSGTQAMCGIYHKSLEQSFLDMLKNDTHKLTHLIKNSKTSSIYFTDEQPFLNLNHPHEYEKALKIINS